MAAKTRPKAYVPPQIGPVYLDETFRFNPQVVRDLCAVHHWTYEDLAAYMGVTKSAIMRWAAGERRPYHHNESELVRLVDKSNALLREHYGSIPPEHRWLPPRLEELRRLGGEVAGSEPPRPEAKLVNLGRTIKRERAQAEDEEAE